MDVENLAKELILKNMTPEQQMAVLDSVRQSVVQAKEVQKRKIGENVDLVVQALKKIESDIRSRFNDVGNSIEKRVASIQDGRDGADGKDGRDGKDGKNGRDGAKGDRGERGQDGRDGVDGVDGVSVSNARIDFDGSLIITLSTGVELNVGEVVSPDLAESIKVITNGGGTSQYVLDTLTSLQTQITNLIPSQTGNSGKFLTTNGTATSWASVAGGLSYQGTWNASTNTPTLTSSVGVNGYYYITDVAGSTNLNGITDWQIGDWLLFNGSVWQKIDQSNLVTSVAGRTGAITLANTDISGLGTMSTQNASSVTITGGTATLTSLTTPTVQATNSSGLSLKNSSGTTQLSMGAGGGDNLSLNVSTNINGTNAQVDISPTGTGHVHIKPTGVNSIEIAPTYVGEIDNMTIGAITPKNGTFTALTATGTTTLANGAILGTPASGDLTNCTFPTLNQNTTGTAAGLSGSQTANYVYAAPNGSSGTASFRAIVAADIPTLNQNTTGTASNVTGTVAFANGGTGATTRQDAMDALAGSVTSGSYLRGDGTDVVMSTIQAADVPTLNQNTTGSAATVTTTINSGVVATTQTAGDNSTKVATTAYVNAVTGTGGLNGFKNRIINGAMVIDQRNAGASVSITDSTVVFLTDRFRFDENTDGSFSAQKVSTAPSGFINSLKFTVTSADTSLAAGQYANLRQNIEGLNVADLAWGTASAATVTLSFWVNSSLTGTFGGSLRNSAADRSYPFTYSISSANTWEQKTITVAGDTTGTWLTTNGIGLTVIWGFGVGSTYLGTANVWQSGNYLAPTGATSVVGTNGATFYITGVQLEKGSTATSFDYRPYTTELQLCQRYYELYDGGLLYLTKLRESDRNRRGNFYFKVTKRAAATITLITSSADGGGAIGATGGIDGGNFESLSTSDGQAPNVTKFSASIEL